MNETPKLSAPCSSTASTDAVGVFCQRTVPVHIRRRKSPTLRCEGASAASPRSLTRTEAGLMDWATGQQNTIL